VLQEELDKINKVKKNGWILLDFPRTLTQAKLLEKGLSGYVSNADSVKDEQKDTFESWSKVITPSEVVPVDFDEQIKAQKSGFDGILFM